MRKHVLVFALSAAILGSGAVLAVAQAPDPHHPAAEQQGSTNPPSPGGPAVQQADPRGGMPGGGMMGGGIMGQGMMGPGMMGPGMMGGGAMGPGPRPRGAMGSGFMAPMMMRMMFALMDADGDGKISLQEFQAAHERIFKAIDANKDGFVTLEEMQSFMGGAGPSAPQQ